MSTPPRTQNVTGSLVLDALFGSRHSLWSRDHFMLDAECHALIENAEALREMSREELAGKVIELVRKYPNATVDGLKGGNEVALMTTL